MHSLSALLPEPERVVVVVELLWVVVVVVVVVVPAQWQWPPALVLPPDNPAQHACLHACTRMHSCCTTCTACLNAYTAYACV